MDANCSISSAIVSSEITRDFRFDVRELGGVVRRCPVVLLAMAISLFVRLRIVYQMLLGFG